MSIFNKIFYALLILLILLMVVVISAVNSSYVIDKIAQEYAPTYDMSYGKISGNVFTGIQIEKLSYSDKLISPNIVYKWNPLTLLQKKISINEIIIENANFDVIKELIASFDDNKSDENTSSSFDFDVSVDNIDISIDPFSAEGISVKKTVLKADSLSYESDGNINVANLFLEIDSNLTQFMFKGKVKKRELLVDSLKIHTLNTIMLETLIGSFTQDNTIEKSKDSNIEESQNLSIPTKVKVKHFSASFLPRVYMSTDIKSLDITIDDLTVDLDKIFENKRDNIHVGKCELSIDTNITSLDMKVSLVDEKINFKYLFFKDVDTLALQNVFMDESNNTKVSDANEQNKSNIWIPKYVSIEELKANVLPAKYSPVEIESLKIRGTKLGIDIDKLLLDNGHLEFNSTSNLSHITFVGDVRSNQLEGILSLIPQRELFELYELPIRDTAIEKIIVDVNASKERIIADISTKAKKILKAKKGEFNIDIDSLNSYVVYDIKTNKLHVKSNAMVSTPYAKDVALTNIFVMDDNISYEGDVKATKLSGLEAKMIEPLKNLDIQYKGDKEGINVQLKSKQLKGNFNSSDMKKGRFFLETLETIQLNEFIQLPAELNTSKVNVKIDLPVNFEKMGPLKGKVNISSNVVNIDVDVMYDEILKIKAKTLMPKHSLLKDFNKEVKWNAIMPMAIDISMKKEDVIVNLNSKAIQGNASYKLKNHDIDGNIKLSGLTTTIHGNVDKKIQINTKITSMKSLEESISTLYTIEEFPPLYGSAMITTNITNMKRVDLILTSRKITYKADRKTKHILNDVKASVNMEGSEIVLDAYNVTFNKQKFFSTKPSIVNIEGDLITLESIWLNDALDVSGQYNKKTKKGMIYTQAKSFPLEHEYVDMNASIDLHTILDAENTNIEGNITLLGGKIKYDISKKTFASDSDIVFVNDIKKKSDNTFMKNLSTNIQVVSREPLVLKQGAIDIKLKPELGINKVQNSDLMVLGTVEILKGGTYNFEGKKFVLDKSAIHFTGNPNIPLLEIKVKYRSLNHLITILISGTPNAPVINFSSNPSLTKEQILSVLLFDSEAGGDAHSGDEMMKMMGGAMAKSALSDLGVKLDHLVLGKGNSIEVGKKLTNKITIIYVEDEVSRVKLQYKHSPRTDSVIQMSEESQSYDIIFKDDF